MTKKYLISSPLSDAFQFFFKSQYNCMCFYIGKTVDESVYMSHVIDMIKKNKQNVNIHNITSKKVYRNLKEEIETLENKNSRPDVIILNKRLSLLTRDERCEIIFGNFIAYNTILEIVPDNAVTIPIDLKLKTKTIIILDEDTPLFPKKVMSFLNNNNFIYNLHLEKISNSSDIMFFEK